MRLCRRLQSLRIKKACACASRILLLGLMSSEMMNLLLSKKMAPYIIQSLLAKRKTGAATCLLVLNLMTFEERTLLAVMPVEADSMVTKKGRRLGRLNSIWRVLSNVKLSCVMKLTKMLTSA